MVLGTRSLDVVKVLQTIWLEGKKKHLQFMLEAATQIYSLKVLTTAVII